MALRTLPRDTAAFTGRTGELDRLVAAVSRRRAGGVIGIHAVDGMAGIGKTAFAVHAAHRLAARFPDGQIFLRLACAHGGAAAGRPGATQNRVPRPLPLRLTCLIALSEPAHEFAHCALDVVFRVAIAFDWPAAEDREYEASQ